VDLKVPFYTLLPLPVELFALYRKQQVEKLAASLREHSQGNGKNCCYGESYYRLASYCCYSICCQSSPSCSSYLSNYNETQTCLCPQDSILSAANGEKKRKHQGHVKILFSCFLIVTRYSRLFSFFNTLHRTLVQTKPHHDTKPKPRSRFWTRQVRNRVRNDHY
jgi:hypothetical protein